jgi:protein-histidine pros-kinase
MSAIADKVSLGQFEAAELDASGSDEISTLARSFGRMRTSLTSAMKMLEE